METQTAETAPREVPIGKFTAKFAAQLAAKSSAKSTAKNSAKNSARAAPVSECKERTADELTLPSFEDEDDAAEGFDLFGSFSEGEEEPANNSENSEQKRLDFQLWGDRYFESQEAAQCARHAVNNLLGGPQFVDEDLQVACDLSCVEYSDDPALHRGSGGWWSVEVIARLFDMTNPPLGQILLANAVPGDFDRVMSSDDFYGFLVNLRNQHWICLPVHNDLLWHVDSKFAPTRISREDFNSILKKFPRCFLVEKHR